MYGQPAARLARCAEHVTDAATRLPSEPPLSTRNILVLAGLDNGGNGRELADQGGTLVITNAVENGELPARVGGLDANVILPT